LRILGTGLLAASPEPDKSTNKTRIFVGDTAVDFTNVGNKLVGEQWISTTNSIVLFRTEITPLPEQPNPTNSSQSNFEPVLRLWFEPGSESTGSGGGVTGLFGLIYMATNFHTPNLARTNPVEILASEDKSRIVVMIEDNGPIYSSTNSGLTWTAFSAPGSYDFPLTFGSKGARFSARTKIHPSPENRGANPPIGNWYAVGGEPNERTFVVTRDTSQPAPILSITHSTTGNRVSWSAAFRGYVLQANSDLSATNWINVTNAIVQVEGENQVFIPSEAIQNFYRLQHP
jgi:hypothetical protein